MTQFYTYMHCKPDLTPFYVGKGSLKRCYELRASRRNLYHQRIVAKCGGTKNIVVLVFKKDSEESAFKSEIRLIKMLRNAGFKLANHTEGGEGGVGNKSRTGQKQSYEERAKKSISQKKACEDPEVIAKKSAAMEKVWSRPSHRDVVIKANTGKKRSSDFCANHAQRMIGNKHGLGSKHPHSVETCIKIAKARANQTFSAETYAKRSASLKNKPWSAARRAAQDKRNANQRRIP